MGGTVAGDHVLAGSRVTDDPDDSVITLDQEVYAVLVDAARAYGASVEEFLSWCCDLALDELAREAAISEDAARLGYGDSR